MEKLLIRVEEAAEMLGLSRSKVYGLVARGEIRSVRVGSSVRVSCRALKEWLDALSQDGQAGMLKPTSMDPE